MKKRVSFSLSQIEYSNLKRIARNHEASVSDLVRTALIIKFGIPEKAPKSLYCQKLLSLSGNWNLTAEDKKFRQEFSERFSE